MFTDILVYIYYTIQSKTWVVSVYKYRHTNFKIRHMITANQICLNNTQICIQYIIVIILILTLTSGGRNGGSNSLLDSQIRLLLHDRWVLEEHGNFLMLFATGLCNKVKQDICNMMPNVYGIW
jgi:hypothetical protein